MTHSDVECSCNRICHFESPFWNYASDYLLLCFCKDSRLNNNSLTGPIPMSLTNVSSLQVL